MFQKSQRYLMCVHVIRSVGLPGRECVLRAVCEVGEEPLQGMGVLGEVLNLIFA